MIAIKNMKMPNSCAECHISEVDCKHKKTAFVRYSRGDFVRPSDCPLTEIVTCKNCKHCYHITDAPKVLVCEKHNCQQVSKNFYCAFTERRE